jgi:DNA-binding transcriptional MerR regulator
MPSRPPKPRCFDDSRLVRISAAARAADLSVQTVEYYIMLALIEPIRDEKAGRWFDDELIKRIKLIRKLNRSGYALRDIRETYLAGPAQAMRTRKTTRSEGKKK